MSIQRLEKIAASCSDSEGRRYLLDALRRIVHGVPADQALGLCGPLAKVERDRLLRLAAALIEGTPTHKAKQIEAIARRLEHFEPRTEAERLVAQAAACCEVPRWRALFDIVADLPQETATDTGNTSEH